LTRFTLHPGEEVRTPLIVLQFWQGDRQRAQNVWRRWMLAHNLPRTAEGKLPPPIFTSCSGGFFPGLKCNEADEFRFIDAFTQAGVRLDYWWMDAGWYPCGDGWPQVGTWTPDPTRFPRGLKAVSDHAHANGMGLIVWFEPERVTPGTWLYENHANWLLGRDGDTKLLNLGHDTARQWLTDHVDVQLTAQGIDLYRQDFNMDPLPYWRANDATNRQGLTEIRHVEGYLAYWDELRRRHPGLVIDSCASGGRRNDLETLRRAVPLLRSDYQSFQGDPAYAPGNQGHTYGLSSWVPYYGQGVYYSERQLLYSVRSSLSPAFGFCADVRKPGVDWVQVLQVAKQWRRVAPCLLGDFHPLTPYRLDGDVWMAWQFDLPEAGRGLVQVFRREQSAYEAARFALRGLDANGRYAVTDLDDAGRKQEYAGSELMNQGLPVALKEKPAAAILVYERTATKP
jgi:alpha-galactosidase